MKLVHMKAGPKLDALVAREIYGVQILGWVTAAYIEGIWGAHPGSSVKGWMAYAEKRPVTTDKLGTCDCKKRMKDPLWRRDKKRMYKGHFSICLHVIPDFSQSLKYALKLSEVAPIAENHVFTFFRTEAGAWGSALHGLTHTFGPLVPREGGGDPTAPLALSVTKAALEAARKLKRQKKWRTPPREDLPW